MREVDGEVQCPSLQRIPGGPQGHLALGQPANFSSGFVVAVTFFVFSVL